MSQAKVDGPAIGGSTVTVFMSLESLAETGEEMVLLDKALVGGMSPAVAKEFLDWVNKLQERSLKPRRCPFCGVPT